MRTQEGIRSVASRAMTGDGRARRRVAWIAAAVLAVTMVGESPASAAPAPWKPPAVPKDVPGVAASPVKHKVRPAWTASAREAKAAPTVVWPASGKAVVSLANSEAAAAARTPSAGTAGAGLVKVGSLPVSVANAPLSADQNVQRGAGGSGGVVGRVVVEIADRAAASRAGVSGLMLKINRADGIRRSGKVVVQVDYSRFADAYGGDWASRLRLVTLPEGKPVVTENNARTRTLTATVSVGADGAATTLAATAGASGDNGDYTATSLSPASTWEVSQQTGAFGWSYPLHGPPAMGGPELSLGLSYSSGSIDGRTSGNNTQGSWIGDGWDLWPGYIERQYKNCSNDKDPMRGNEPNNKTVTSWDECWLKPEGNATVSFNGKATELVKSAGSTWKGTSDDGSKIELLTDLSLGNGDADGEYWKITKTDGTQYYFGRNKGPGGSSGSVGTNSVWTTQVYGNHPDEPGYKAGDYAGSRTTQGWRWNLDYVVDPHGNTMTYFYTKETGAYGREGDSSKRTTYDRGGWLSRVEYGNRADASATTQAAAQVVFDVADRCDSNCWSGTDPVTASWLDTPWDQYCKQAPCTDRLSPTYWTTKRLSRIRSQVYSGTGAIYNDVEWWTLRHTYLQSGGNEAKPMWLAGITRTGKVTSTNEPEVSDPEVVFDPGSEARPNRVISVGDGRSSLFRYRINTITTESGAQIVVSYSDPECVRTALPAVDKNTMPCSPQYYGPSGVEPTLDWFHKYRVTRVDVYDNTGGFAHEQRNYDYLDAPAWHYDDSELVDEKKRTWGEYRGYGKVRVRSGLEPGVQSATEYLYLRGMDGDKQLPTGTRDVWVTDSQGYGLEDHEAYAGMLREESTLVGAGGASISGTINTPGRQGPTAASGPQRAWMTNIGTTRSRLKLADGSTRWTKTVTTVNTDNLPTQVEDLGDESVTSDDVCIRTSYARNPNNWMLGRAKKTEKVGVNCSMTPSLPADMLSSTRITYDKDTNDWDSYLPVTGDIAKVEEIDSWTGSTPNWITVGHSTYDAVGRVTDTWDALNRRTGTAYTPTLAGPVTSTRVTNPLDHQVTTTYATAWHLPTAVVDNANAIPTDLSYDALGRLRRVWLPGRSKATYPNAASREYAYTVRNNAPTAITTKTLMPVGASTYATSITLYDGLVRERQTQTQAPGGGRVLLDTIYDSRGLVQLTSAPYYDTTNAPPDTTLVAGPGKPAIPARTENIYDGAGRLTDAIFKVGVDESTNEKWRTTTSYVGERVNVTPPAGGTATTTITDARGHTVTTRQYKNPADVGSDNPATFDATAYAYTDRGELSSVTDSAGNTWRYSYDQRGRRIREEDPDKGVTTSAYDMAGQLTTATDARDVTLAYTYDDLGRKTTIRDGSTTGPKRAEWTYDTLLHGVGKPTESIRYEPPGSTNAYISEIGSYDTAGRPDSTKVTIPASEGGLCAAGLTTPCTYSYATTYRANGAIATITLPAAAGLASEKLTYTYTEVGAPDGLDAAGGTLYINAVSYDKLGHLTQRVFGDHGKRIWLTDTFDQNTGRLTNSNAIPELKPEIFNFTYDHDDAGNVTKIADAPSGGQTPDTECYRYDYLRRLTNAWTPTSNDCAADPTVAGLGGPASYWHSYTYDSTGNRTEEIQHGTTSTTRTYTYPAPGGAAGNKPHAVTKIDTVGATTKTDTYTYDQVGNTKTRPGGATGQTLNWNNEGQLATVTDSTGATNHLYDAGGNRLIRRDPTGTATLYLPGGIEVRKPATGNATCTRYYTHAGTVIATRTSDGRLDWIASDHHGTAETTINSTDLTVARRRSLPFGTERPNPAGTWPTTMDKGFVGGTKDNTGLTHLGAREYDPSTGRFISVDIIQDLADLQQWNGYAYADNNPSSWSDPGGTCIPELCAGGAAGYEHKPGSRMPGCGKSCNSGSGNSGSGNAGSGNNSSGNTYTNARDTYFTGGVRKGGVRKTYQTDARAPGNGIIVTRLFIQDCKILLVGHGDCRDFTDDLDAGARVIVAWDTETGEVSITANQSCVTGACKNADQIGEGNDLVIKESHGSGSAAGLYFKYKGTNSISSFGIISGEERIDITSGGDVNVQVDGTGYPSIEIYQYRGGQPTRNLGQDEQSFSHKNSWLSGQAGPLPGLNMGTDRRIEFHNGEPTFNPNVKYLTPGGFS
ncbi:RHS repeat-associated core domain-containing protein [Micromonospora rifamycinica]|uniref:RHS repeat domain-containing protein n=1 Tax=Micromonospora rifamycinica TaxID=291594 RepID=UPI003427AD89